MGRSIAYYGIAPLDEKFNGKKKELVGDNDVKKINR
jgi:hypothetical protein